MERTKDSVVTVYVCVRFNVLLDSSSVEKVYGAKQGKGKTVCACIARILMISADCQSSTVLYE